MAATAALPRDRRSVKWGTPLTYVLALAIAAVSIAPVAYVVLSGFRTTGQLAADPAGLPDPWVWVT
jgi:raffinose/stachyose/melibiose transport system permease protein